jgi:tetratricopeptide (TPR) repeat protein
MRAKGEFAQVVKNMREAQKKSGQPVKRGTMAHEHDVFFQLCESAAHLGDLDEMQRSAHRLEELASRDKHNLYLAVAQRTFGIGHRLAGEYAEAGMRLNQSLLLLNELGAHWQIGRTLFEMGELDRALTDFHSAENHYRLALDQFKALGALPDIEKSQFALENLTELLL